MFRFVASLVLFFVYCVPCVPLRCVSFRFVSLCVFNVCVHCCVVLCCCDCGVWFVCGICVVVLLRVAACVVVGL